MSDEFTEVSSEGWFSRLGGAVKGIFGGFILIFVAAFLLFWNEGRSVKRYKTLKQGRGMVVNAEINKMDSSKDGKLVHLSGKATTTDILKDNQFGVSVNALKLNRNVQYYQWVESKQTKKRKKVGGGEETVTTYSYNKKWVSSSVDSSSFKKKAGHFNTKALNLSDTSFKATNVAFGAYKLSSSQVGRISGASNLNISKVILPYALRNRAKIATENEIYIKQNLNSSMDEIGDMRVTFSAVYPKDITIISQQTGNTFKPLALKKGSIDLLTSGTKTADEMFTSAEKSNKGITWFLRILGLVLMIAAFNMIFKVLEVVADVLPFVGNIVGAGIGIISFLLGLILSFLIIAIAWFAYRPLLSIALLLIIGGAIFGIKSLTSKAKTA